MLNIGQHSLGWRAWDWKNYNGLDAQYRGRSIDNGTLTLGNGILYIWQTGLFDRSRLTIFGLCYLYHAICNGLWTMALDWRFFDQTECTFDGTFLIAVFAQRMFDYGRDKGLRTHVPSTIVQTIELGRCILTNGLRTTDLNYWVWITGFAQCTFDSSLCTTDF